MRPTLDVGLVDVDPVVGEQVLAVEHERDGQEVAVAQALGGLDDALRGRRVGDADRRAQRQRRDDGRGLDDLVGRVDGDDAAVLELDRVAGVSRRTSPPSSSMRAVIVSHIWPGP